jgi:hypothetical protein
VCESQSQKNPSQKWAGGVPQGVGPKFKPQYYKTKQNKKTQYHKKKNFFSILYPAVWQPSLAGRVKDSAGQVCELS